MDFEFTPEQRQLRKSVREFAEAEIKPHVLKWDEEQSFPLDVFRKLGKLGYLGVLFPEEYGGAGLGYIEYAILMEELARVDPSVALIVAAHVGLCSSHINLAASHEQKLQYLPKLASGEWIGCWSLTEPESGSDAASMRTAAVQNENCWTLNGGKTFTTNAHVADICVAMAVTDRAKTHHGISAFIVDIHGSKGFRVGKKENKLGMRASVTGEVLFDNCCVPASNLCGAAGEGFIDTLKVLDAGRIAIAALSVGTAQGAYEAALQYSKTRRQFGKAISEFQSIQNKIADMATEIDAARLLTLRAAALKNQGKKFTKEASMAKLFASEMATRCCDEAIQIFGGYGFMKDYPVEKFYRDVKLLTIGEGTSEIQRMVIARQILKG